MPSKASGNGNVDTFIQRLAKEREKRINEITKKTYDYLKKIRYYELDYGTKVDFLVSEKGQIIIETLVKNQTSFSEMANLLRFGQKELHDLARENYEIFDAMDRGRAKSIDEVEQSMFKLANGYVETLEEIVETKDNEGNAQQKVKKSQQLVVPNFYAQKYILESKRAMEYAEQQAKRDFDKNRISLEVIVIGQDELRTD